MTFTHKKATAIAIINVLMMVIPIIFITFAGANRLQASAEELVLMPGAASVRPDFGCKVNHLILKP